VYYLVLIIENEGIGKVPILCQSDAQKLPGGTLVGTSGNTNVSFHCYCVLCFKEHVQIIILKTKIQISDSDLNTQKLNFFPFYLFGFQNF
jgi:hypothetical protein